MTYELHLFIEVKIASLTMNKTRQAEHVVGHRKHVSGMAPFLHKTVKSNNVHLKLMMEPGR